MWPFSGRSEPTIPDALDQAADLACRSWIDFSETSGIPGNVHLRDRVAYFAPGCRRAMLDQFPILARASEEVLLLTMLEGIERTGLESRRMIELQLGIILPHRR